METAVERRGLCTADLGEHVGTLTRERDVGGVKVKCKPTFSLGTASCGCAPNWKMHVSIQGGVVPYLGLGRGGGLGTPVVSYAPRPMTTMSRSLAYILKWFLLVGFSDNF